MKMEKEQARWIYKTMNEIRFFEEKVHKIFSDGQIPGFVHLYVCLLYTSPSPRDRQKSRMPSSA